MARNNSGRILSTHGNEDNSMSVNNINGDISTGNNSYTLEEKWGILNTLLSVFKIRLKLINAKCGASQSTSKYLTLNNATIMESDYNEMLFMYFLKLQQRTVYELMFKRAVDSRVIWDIMRQNIRLNCSFPLPRPPMLDGSQKERKIMAAMENVSDSCITLKDVLKHKEIKNEKYLESITRYVDAIDKLLEYKNLQLKSRRSENPQVINTRHINFVNKTNITTNIIAKLCGNENINYLEHPEIVDIIRKSRNVVTESIIEAESKYVLKYL